MHHYRHHIGDYRRDTGHLSLLEHGVYRQMLDVYYTDENPLTLDEAKLMRLLCARTADEQQSVKNVLQDFFVCTENGYEHKRCEAEIRELYGKSESARKSAKARWEIERKKAEAMRTHNERNANEEQTQCDSNANASNNHTNASKSDAVCMLPSNPVTQLPSNPKRKATEITFDQFFAKCKDSGELPIPEDDPVYKWAESVGLPIGVLFVGWQAFKCREWKDGKGKVKKYADWRAVFRNYCKNPDWLGVWKINREGEFFLTDKGKQIERELSGVAA